MVIIHVKSRPSNARLSRPRKSRSRRRRERATRMAALFMDLQESYSDFARG